MFFDEIVCLFVCGSGGGVVLFGFCCCSWLCQVRLFFTRVCFSKFREC